MSSCSVRLNIKTEHVTGEMAQQVKVLTAKADGLSFIPRNHMVKEKLSSHSLSSDLHLAMRCGVCSLPHVDTHK